MRVAIVAGLVPLAAGLANAPVASRARFARAPLVAPLLQLAPLAPRVQMPVMQEDAVAVSEAPEAVEEAAPAPAPPSGFMTSFSKFSSLFSNLFPLWTFLVAAMGLVTPGVFLSISTEYFTGLLGLLMLSMGITLTLDDFKRVLAKPVIMLLGFAACYLLMPAMALGLSNVLGLPYATRKRRLAAAEISSHALDETHAAHNAHTRPRLYVPRPHTTTCTALDDGRRRE